ncbi:hypothetical protein H257_02146 [Aphanomyces astaci]|uniref:Peptidase M14 domain-containing protein n=1 Tax=Aphanomyces astaci TaxID=112090 RepID=W4H6H1_APHAT|nr:hypothetical protein H257_02146 [Aphanomyces astaci]ETV87171.1 hypothetical protein H257_02146 [Aphanomyces astaci]RQM22025.1 hypothetical protein B5M09_012164 [Aphanomyces astaci]|eukprot:XP_009823970.1 hypothetical protein H257_02146 [Aphanomyces astaci]
MKTIAILALALSTAAVAVGTTALIQGTNGEDRTNATKVQRLQDDIDINRQCHHDNHPNEYLETLTAGQYTSSKFYNCFRSSDQIYEYVDALAKKNPTLLKREPISTSYHGKNIYAYKLTRSPSKNNSLVFQSLVHAREWITGSSNLFALSSILDDIAKNITTVADKFNLYFVPIVNIDGYDISWIGHRHQLKSANQVDLSLNWPGKYIKHEPLKETAEHYPGKSPLSEQETTGISNWIRDKQSELAGWVDLLSTGGLVLYPNETDTTSKGKFKRLGDNVAVEVGYTAQATPHLNIPFGTFPYYFYPAYRKPVLTIHVAGSDFVAPASTIRIRGKEIVKALTKFGDEVSIFEDSRESC